MAAMQVLVFVPIADICLIGEPVGIFLFFYHSSAEILMPAKIQSENDLNESLKAYYHVLLNGKDRKGNRNDITYFWMKTRWIRYSDFNIPQHIEVLKF